MFFAGCKTCQTAKRCDQFKYKEERLRLKNEVAMRSKAMQDPNFPNEGLIKEFLDRKDHVKELELTWKQPNLVQFVVSGFFLCVSVYENEY